MKFSLSRKVMMNWNGFPISLILFAGVFYLSTSADAKQTKFEVIKGNLKNLMKNAKDLQRKYKKEFFRSKDYIAGLDTRGPLLKPANCSHICPYPNATRVEDLDFLSRVKAVFDHMISEEGNSSYPVNVDQVSEHSPSYLMNECRKFAEAALKRLGPRPSCDCGLPRPHNWTTALLPRGTSFPASSLKQRRTMEYIILRDIIIGVKGILSHNGKVKPPGKDRVKPPGRGKKTKTPRKPKKKEEKQDKK